MNDTVLNIGLLYRTVDLLYFLQDNDFTFDEFERSYPVFRSVQSHYLLELCSKCLWASYEDNNKLKPTIRGKYIMNIESEFVRLRHQIKDIIETYSPNWMKLVKRGRNDIRRHLSNNEKQCFEMARLLDNYDLDTISWWDSFIINSFEEKERQNYEIGRKGELLSIKYEENRTGIKPKLISLDVNFAGYDILSQVNHIDKSPLYIEVKCSSLPWKNAKFYLTRHEWDTFSMNKSARIHIWSLKPSINLAVLKYDNIKSSIPQDIGQGRWVNVEIPYTISSPSCYF